MRRAWFVLTLSMLLVSLPASARAAPVSRADHLAAELRRDPVYVTDHSPRSLPADAAGRIKRSVARLGVPTFVAVTLTTGFGNRESDQSLIPLLRDRLGKDGVYIVVSPAGGDGEAQQFGGGRTLPVDDAWTAAELEMPYDAGAVAVVERFVDIALSGQAKERRRHPRPRPPSKVQLALDEADRADRRTGRLETAAFGGGAALSGLSVLGLLVGRRVRRTKPREAK